MKMHVEVMKRSVTILIIICLFSIFSLSGCARNPKDEFESCIKEEGKVNPNYYAVQLKCSNQTGYSP